MDLFPLQRSDFVIPEEIAAHQSIGLPAHSAGNLKTGCVAKA